MPHFEPKNLDKKLLIAEGNRLLNLIQSGNIHERDYACLYEKVKIGEIIDLREIVEDNQNNEPNWLSLQASALSRISVDEGKRVNYLAAVVCVAWALSDICVQKGVDVTRGSYTILGDTRVYEFFLDYVKFATNSENPGFFTNASCFAYRRNPQLMHSSHYKKEPLQYGIDLRFGLFQESLPILPHGHSHLLFGRINSGKKACASTFFKFEPKGMGTIYELAHHGADYAKSGKVEGVTHREKDVPPDLKKIYASFCKEVNSSANSKYVHDMWQHINSVDVAEGSVAYTLKDQFLELASTIFKGNEHLDLRYGSEAIFRLHNNAPKTSPVMSAGILHLFPKYQSYFKSKDPEPAADWDMVDFSEGYDSDESKGMSGSSSTTSLSDSSTAMSSSSDSLSDSSSAPSTPKPKTVLSRLKFW